MKHDFFYINNNMTPRLESFVSKYNSYSEFEKDWSDELLNEDCKVGNYLSELLYKYDKKASVVSIDARLASGYVGNIINGKKDNPSRDVLIRICLTLHANVEETQYLLKYAGHSPLYVRRKRDVIIWYGLMKNEELDIVNDNLIERNLTPLYKE